jgi:ABC-type Fe2+-enterobactin transport system substrate-binding protein
MDTASTFLDPQDDDEPEVSADFDRWIESLEQALAQGRQPAQAVAPDPAQGDAALAGPQSARRRMGQLL